jgi:hypothetical protein
LPGAGNNPQNALNYQRAFCEKGIFKAPHPHIFFDSGPLAHGLMLDETGEKDDILSQVIKRPVPRYTSMTYFLDQ